MSKVFAHIILWSAVIISLGFYLENNKSYGVDSESVAYTYKGTLPEINLPKEPSVEELDRVAAVNQLAKEYISTIELALQTLPSEKVQQMVKYDIDQFNKNAETEEEKIIIAKLYGEATRLIMNNGTNQVATKTEE